MVISAYTFILLYILTSNLLNIVIAGAGVYSPLVLACGLIVVLAFAYILSKAKASDFFLTSFATFFAVYVVITLSATLNKYIYHGAELYKVLSLVLIIGLVGLFVSDTSSAYLLRVYSVIASALFIVVVVLSLSNARIESVTTNGFFDKKNLTSMFISSVFAFLPLLLPFLKQEKFSLKPMIICGSLTLIYSLFSQLTVPGFVVKDDKNIFLEMSKNISLGKFFQRMEFVSVLVYTVVSLCIIVYLFSLIRNKIDNKFTLKSKRLILSFACISFVAVSSYIGAGDSAVLGLIKILSIAAILLSLIFSFLNKIKKPLLTISLAVLMLLNMSACMNYNEIDKLEYPLIITVGSDDSSHQKFYFRTESTTYYASSDTIAAALNAINSHNVKQLDLSQLGLVILSNDSYEDIMKIIEEIQSTDIHNSVLIALTSDNAEEISQADYSIYSGISEYLGEYKSKIGEYDFLDKTAYSAYVSSKTLTNAITLLKIRFKSNVPLLDGALSLGKYDKVEIDNRELNLIKTLKESNKIEYDESIKISGYDASEREVELIYSLYNKTLDDVFDLDYCKQLGALFDWNNTIFNKKEGIKVDIVK